MLLRATLLLSALTAIPACAQFRSIEITFEGIGCASCIDSLPSRLQRMRGVESATVDSQHGVVKLKLAAENRVRLEQVRDSIEQDGTKAKSASVVANGDLTLEDGKWIFHPVGVSSTYQVKHPEAAGGSYVVVGKVTNMRPEGALIVIEATELRHPAK